MKRSLILLPLFALLPLAACSSDADSDANADAKPSSNGTATTSTAPTATAKAGEIDNCGFKQTFDTAPERIFTIKSTSIELALALGVGDKIVGTAFNDGPVLDLEGQPVDVPVLSDKAPDDEAVLKADPDLIYAGWESNLEADTAGDRETLATLGVKTYVSPAACQEPDYQPNPMTYDKLFEEFVEAGKVLGAEDSAAADLVSAQRAELAEVTKAQSGTTALWWSSGDDTPFVGGGIGAPQMVLDAVGLENIAKDVPKTWDSLGWESIVAADPDVIVLVDAAWNSAADKISTLKSNAATQNMAAVKAEKFLIIPFASAEAGVRSVPAATDLSAQLGELDLLEK